MNCVVVWRVSSSIARACVWSMCSRLWTSNDICGMYAQMSEFSRYISSLFVLYSHTIISWTFFAIGLLCCWVVWERLLKAVCDLFWHSHPLFHISKGQNGCTQIQWPILSFQFAHTGFLLRSTLVTHIPRVVHFSGELPHALTVKHHTGSLYTSFWRL